MRRWRFFRVRGLVTQFSCRVSVWTAAVARTDAYGIGSVGKERVLACLLSTFCSNDQVLIFCTRILWLNLHWTLGFAILAHAPVLQL